MSEDLSSQSTTFHIRNLLIKAFSDEGFTQFCFDNFRKVHENFGVGMSFGNKVQYLLEYCEKTNSFDKLLILVRGYNPNKFAEFSSSLMDILTPALYVLLISNEHCYSETSFYESLKQILGGKVETKRHLGSYQNVIEREEINTIFIDPDPHTSGSFDQAKQFINKVRDESSRPIIWVICSKETVIQDFHVATGGEFNRFFLLNYEKVFSSSDKELVELIRKCKIEYQYKYRDYLLRNKI